MYFSILNFLKIGQNADASRVDRENLRKSKVSRHACLRECFLRSGEVDLDLPNLLTDQISKYDADRMKLRTQKKNTALPIH